MIVCHTIGVSCVVISVGVLGPLAVILAVLGGVQGRGQRQLVDPLNYCKERVKSNVLSSLVSRDDHMIHRTMAVALYRQCVASL